ncbi:hypothetical protein [Caldisericum sp. AR60]
MLAVNTKVKPVRSDRIIPEKLKELIKQGLRVDICGICMD